MHATEADSFMLRADLEKGLQSVTGTDVKLNSVLLLPVVALWSGLAEITVIS